MKKAPRKGGHENERQEQALHPPRKQRDRAGKKSKNRPRPRFWLFLRSFRPMFENLQIRFHLMLMKKKTAILSLCLLTAGALDSAPKPLDSAVAALLAVGPKGEGNAAASAAWPKVAAKQPHQIPALLAVMDGANALARNWLRAAVDTIAERAATNGRDLPVKELKAFLDDQTHAHASRRLAYELLLQAEPEKAAALAPGFIDDPAPELRRDAVALLLHQAAEKENAALYHKALRAARDVDQIQAASEALKKAGKTVDLPKIMGFLMRWKVIGPFDNSERGGFDVPYPPEKQTNFDATYPGKDAPAAWTDLSTADPFGMVDVNKAYGELKEVVAYAHTTFDSPAARDVQLRLGCKNAWKIWLNGKLLFARDEYHRGMRIDQYVIPASLQKGPNAILVKLCQNEQMESWTKQWQFQLRVTDSSGSAVLAANRGPTPEAHAPKR